MGLIRHNERREVGVEVFDQDTPRNSSLLLSFLFAMTECLFLRHSVAVATPLSSIVAGCSMRSKCKHHENKYTELS